MKEQSTIVSHYCNRRLRVRRISRGIMFALYIAFFALASIPRTVATTTPKATQRSLTQFIINPPTTTQTVPIERIPSLLYNLRGGSQRTNRNWSRARRNTRGKNNNSRRKRAFLRQVSKLNGWKSAMEKVAPRTRTSNTQNIRKSSARAIVTAAAIKTKTKRDKKAKLDESNDYIQVQKPKPAGLAQYNPFKMYYACMGIVTLWMATGTLFYSYTNEWPLPQSFFYAVDAGMSIGFCTDVAETKLVSKAFTIIYIIMGASVVGGALALFIEDIVDGVVEGERKKNNIVLTKEYQLLLGKEAFEKLDVSQSDSLTRDEFGMLLKFVRSKNPNAKPLSEDDIDVLWSKFDRIEDEAIRFEEFEGTYRGIEGLLDSLLTPNTPSSRSFESHERTTLRSLMTSIATKVSSFAKPIMASENRIYVVFLAWVILGIVWGMLDQGWDPITATHFAISALATGGLTAPPVDSNGILPPEPAIFCGLYCLFGIPLMAITFGHFARVLVSGHVAAMEEWALTRPITATDYEIAKTYLIKSREGKINPDVYVPRSILRRRSETPSSSPSWRGLRLSDFIVLQIFRQGRISVEAIDILRKEFELLDKDKTGLLTLEEATNWATQHESTQ